MVLPSPFTTDDLLAGYVYGLAFRQFVFDRPQAGRAFVEDQAVLQGTPGVAH